MHSASSPPGILIPLISALFHVLRLLTSIRDNRSFRLNFEITILSSELSLVEAAERMFEADFARSTRATAADYTARPWWFRLAARACRLMAPIQ